MDLTDAYPDSFALLSGTLDSLNDADLARPTPCAGWTLADLLAHLTAQQRGFSRAAVGHDELDDWAVAAPDRSARDGLKAFRRTAFQSVFRMAAALAAGAELTLAEYRRTVPSRTAAGMQIVDNVAHAWDVAQARDLPLPVDADLLEVALRITERIPTDPAGRGRGFAFGPALEPAGSTPLDRFLALLGRDPAWLGSAS